MHKAGFVVRIMGLVSLVAALAVLVPSAVADVVDSTGFDDLDADPVTDPSGMPLGGPGFLGVATLEIEFSNGPTNFGHVMGIVWDGARYWSVDGGTSPSDLNEYDANGSLLNTHAAQYDGRSLVDHPGGTVHAASFTADIHLGLAPYTQVCADVLPNSQSGHAVLDSGNIVAHDNGVIAEYTFPGCVLVNTVALNPVCPSCNTYPNSVTVASDGQHLFVLSNTDEVWVYDYPGANHIATVDLDAGGDFDGFNTPFSLSFGDSSAAAGNQELLYVLSNSTGTIRGYRIHGEKIPTIGITAMLILAVGLIAVLAVVLVWRRGVAA